MQFGFIFVGLLCCGIAAAQASEHTYGLVRTSDEAYLNYKVAGVLPTGVLPVATSLEQYLPPPGQQGNQGSCTAWSTTFALRTALQVISNGTWQPLGSASRQFSPAFVFNVAKANTGVFNCGAGIAFSTALDILQTVGAPTLAAFPYDESRCDLSPTQDQVQQARRYLIANWERTSDLSVNRLKAHLAAGDPILAGIDIYPSFDRASGTNTITGNAGPWRGYHAILLIGYDDTRSAFRLQNSWGTDWGDGGRAWLDYNTFTAIAHEAYRVNPVLPPSAFELSSAKPQTRRFGIVNDATRPDFLERMGQLFQALGADEKLLRASANSFGVRVNAFAEKAAALSMAKSIAEGSSGLDARVVAETLQGKALYSVVVGAGLSSAEASLVLSRAKKAGFRLAAIIPLK